MFYDYRYADDEEIEELIKLHDNGKTDLLTLTSRICVRYKIKMCCFIKLYPQIPPTTFKNRVHSVRRGHGNGKRVYFFMNFF